MATITNLQMSLTEIERNIQTLEEWQKQCGEGSSLELRHIIITKINTLSNRMSRVRDLIDRCETCGAQKEQAGSYGVICIKCNGFGKHDEIK